MAVRNPDSIVAPRVIAPVTGEILLLADVIRDHIGTSVRTIHLNGSGKSSAIGFLKNEFADDHHVQVVDDLKWQEALKYQNTKLLVFSGNSKECPSSSTAASLMIRIEPEWKPTGRGPLRFNYARLAGANWHDVSLNNAGLSHSDVGQADLSGADLTICVATTANFRRANLRGANLLKAHF